MTVLRLTSRLISRTLITPHRKSLLNINKDFLKVFTLNSGNVRNSSSSQNYSVTEVKIDVPGGGVIAGKLWQSAVQKVTPTKPHPPVICVHGWLDNAGSFDNLIPLLMSPDSNAPCTFFALDLPGHGFTTYCPQIFYDAHIEGLIAIRRVLAHFGWEEVSYIGHSMGGIIGFLFTSFYPDSVHKFVALDNIRTIQHYPLITILKSSLDLVFEVEEKAKLPPKGIKFDELVQKFYDGRKRQNPISLEACKILLQRGAVPVKGDKDLFQYSHNLRTLIPGQEGRLRKTHLQELATYIKSPICFIKANSGNVFETDEEVEEFFKFLRDNLGQENVERHNTDGYHHFHMDNPKPIAEIVKKFLQTSFYNNEKA